MNKKKLFSSLLFLLLLTGLFIQYVTPVQAHDMNGDEESPYEINVTFGIDGWAKWNRNIPVTVQITNHGDAFSGKVRILYKNNQSGPAACTRYISCLKNETSKAEFSLNPEFIYEETLSVELLDKSDQVVLSEIVRVSASANDYLYIATLSDTSEKLSYMDNMAISLQSRNMFVTTKLVNLTKDTFPSIAGNLLMFDTIVINHFDMDMLSQSQYSALMTWVKRGGCLLIGTGNAYEQTMHRFEDDFLLSEYMGLSGKITDFSLDGYSFTDTSISENDFASSYTEDIFYAEGIPEIDNTFNSEYYSAASTSEGISFVTKNLQVQEPLALECADFSVKYSDIYDTLLCQMLSHGSGKICIAGFNLADESFISWEHCRPAIQNIFHTVLKINTDRAQNYRFYEPYYVTGLLSNYIEDRLPHIEIFVILIILYLCFVIPSGYFILHKIDKRQWFWLYVPVTVCIFTVLVLFVGNTSLQNEPYMNYCSILSFNGNTANERTYFSVTTPRNRDFQYSTDNDYDISFIDAASYNSYDYVINYKSDLSKEAAQDYQLNLIFSDEGTKAEVKNVNAFDSKYFLAEKDIESSGNIETNIHYIDGFYTGSVTNHTGYDLSDAFLKFDQTVIPVGHLDNGQTYTISYADDFISADIYNFADVQFYSHTDVTIPQRKRIIEAYSYIRSYSTYTSTLLPDYSFCAFVEGYNTSIGNLSGFACEGSTFLWQNISVEYLSGGTYHLPDLMYGSAMVMGNADLPGHVFYGSEVSLECFIPSTVKSIQSIQLMIPSDKNVEYMLYNYSSKSYDTVFSENDPQVIEGEIANDYCHNGTIKLKIVQNGQNDYSSAKFPVISLTGRVN